MAVADEPRLGCGRPVDGVWAHLDRPPDSHERQCPYCQQARADLEPLAAATRDLQQEDEDLLPSPRVKSSVMDLVRAEVRRGRSLPLRTAAAPGPATLTISEQAVTSVVWETGDGLPGVRARHCRVSVADTRPAPDEATVVDIELHIAVVATAAIPAVVERLRNAVRESVAQATGLQPRHIDVVVEDVFDE